MVLRWSVAPGSQERLFLFQEILKVLLSDLIDQPFEPAAVFNPLTNRLVERPGDGGANLFLTRAGVEIERRMLEPALTATVGLAAGAVAEYQRAAKKGLVGQ